MEVRAGLLAPPEPEPDAEFAADGEILGAGLEQGKTVHEVVRQAGTPAHPGTRLTEAQNCQF
jgi:hypothetical protein